MTRCNIDITADVQLIKTMGRVISEFSVKHVISGRSRIFNGTQVIDYSKISTYRRVENENPLRSLNRSTNIRIAYKNWLIRELDLPSRRFFENESAFIVILG